jgi:hypothetical protein
MAKKRAKDENLPSPRKQNVAAPAELLADLRSLIEASRGAVAQAFNAALVLLYWQVGSRIRTDVLRNRRAAYGEQILPTLSAKLAPEYGQGFGERNLARMVRFAEVFPDRDIVLTLSRQLSWCHFVEIVSLGNDLQCDSYAEMCQILVHSKSFKSSLILGAELLSKPEKKIRNIPVQLGREVRLE